MKNLISGAVKNHRIPGDYQLSYVQPWNNKRFLRDVGRSFRTRLITRQYAVLPLSLLFFFTIPYFMF